MAMTYRSTLRGRGIDVIEIVLRHLIHCWSGALAIMAEEDVDSDGKALDIGVILRYLRYLRYLIESVTCSITEEIPFGPRSPPLTDQIASVLRRYPDGGQILKVSWCVEVTTLTRIFSSPLCSETSGVNPKRGRCWCD